MLKPKKNSQKKEIMWNIINSLLGGGIYLVGALTNGGISVESFCGAFLTAMLIAMTQFRSYWMKEEAEYSSTKLFSFLK